MQSSDAMVLVPPAASGSPPPPPTPRDIHLDHGSRRNTDPPEVTQWLQGHYVQDGTKNSAEARSVASKELGEK